MRILIADDVEVSRVSLQMFLEKMGHQVLACKDGQEVLEKLFIGDLPQLVFLDWMMPTVSGIEVSKQIRLQKSSTYTYIVLVTAKNEVGDVIEGLRAGANDYITKPLNLDELHARVQVAMQMIDLHNTVEVQKIKLMASEKMAGLGEMASGIIHEIGAPISIVQNQLEKIKIESGPHQTIALEKALQMVHRVSTLMASLSCFAADSNQEQFVEKPMRQLFTQIFNFCHEKLKENEVEFRVKPFNENLVCEVQVFHFAQALMGLLHNSIEAVTEHKEKWVELEIFETAEIAHFAITDSGFGIISSVQEKMMQPFFSTKTQGRHSGLGLSLARGVAEQHQGRLVYDEKSFNTRFILSIPKKQPAKIKRTG